MRIIEVLQNGLPGCIKIIAERGVERIRRKPNHGECAVISSVIRQTPILSEPNASCARPFSNSCISQSAPPSGMGRKATSISATSSPAHTSASSPFRGRGRGEWHISSGARATSTTPRSVQTALTCPGAKFDIRRDVKPRQDDRLAQREEQQRQAPASAAGAPNIPADGAQGK